MVNFCCSLNVHIRTTLNRQGPALRLSLYIKIVSYVDIELPRM